MLLKVFLALAFSTPALASTQEFSFQKGNLNIEGKFPFDVSHPLTISGYDKMGKAYKFVILTKPQGKDIYLLTYHLSYQGQKSSGSLVIEKGKQGEVVSEIDGKEIESKFSVTIKK